MFCSALSRTFKFPTFYREQLIQGRYLASFFGNGTKFKTPSEIKPPLKKKAEDGVRVLIMIWGETTSIMGTHDTETENFFKGKKKTLF